MILIIKTKKNCHNHFVEKRYNVINDKSKHTCTQTYAPVHTRLLKHIHNYTHILSSILMQWELLIHLTFNYEGFVPDLSRINSYFHCFNLAHIYSTGIEYMSVTIIEERKI